MNDVAHVPQLSYNLISLPSMTLKGHTYTGDKDGVTLKLKGGETLFSPLVGKLCRQYGFRPEAAGSMVDTACATIAPGKAKAPITPTDINILHCTFGHTHEVLLKKKQQGVNPSGKLHKCRGCPTAKGLWKSTVKSTHTGADTLRLSRAPAAAASYCQRGGVYSGGGRERGGGVKSRRKKGARLGQRVQPRQRSGGVAPGVTRNARGASGRIRSRGSGGAEGNPPVAELGAGAAWVRKATPQHHRPPPGGEAPAAELGAGAAGVRKATPRHHRPPSGGEAPAAEFAAAATGVRKATPRHQRFPPGGEAPAAKFVAAATGVRKATPRHHRTPREGRFRWHQRQQWQLQQRGQPYQQQQQQRQRRWGLSRPREETCAGPGGFWRAPRTTEWPHEVSVAGLGHGRVLRGRPVGIRHEGHGSRKAHGEEGRGGRTSSRLSAGRATGEGT